MARVQYGAIVTKIQGKLGGHIFQDNAFGSSMKAWVIGKPHSTSPHLDNGLSLSAPNNLTKCVNAWGNMTDLERQAWNNFASTFPQPSKNNPAVSLPGYQLFVKYNQLRLTNGHPLQTTCLGVPWSPPGLSYVIKADTTHLQIVFFGAVDATASYVLIRITNYIKNTWNKPKGQLRTVTSSTIPGTIFDASLSYTNQFIHLPSVGDRLYLEVSFIHTVSPRISAAYRQILIVQAI